MSRWGRPDDDPLLPALSELMAEGLQPADVPEERRQAMKSKLVDRVRRRGPPGTTTLRAEAGVWEDYLPGIRRKLLRHDPLLGNETALYDLAPGAVIPAHHHDQLEECLVLEGEIDIEGFLVRSGDMHVAEVGCDHPDITAVHGALLLIRSQIHEIPRLL